MPPHFRSATVSGPVSCEQSCLPGPNCWPSTLIPNSKRCGRPAHFSTVLDLFLTRHPEYVAVVVGAQDLGLGTGRNSDRIFTRFQLPQLTALALMGEADLFLGVDSCMLHAADLYGIAGVSLFGPTTPRQWGFRFSRHHRDLRGSRGKMANLHPWQVLEALEEVETEAIKTNVKQIRSA